MIIHIHSSDIANAIEGDDDAGFEVLCAVMDAYSGDVSAFVDAGYSGSNHHDRLPAFLRDLANAIESAA